MTETMIAPTPQIPAPAGTSRCEISTLKEAARALRLMDREVTRLRQEHQLAVDRQTQSLRQARAAALAGFIFGCGGFVLALAAFFLR